MLSIGNSANTAQTTAAESIAEGSIDLSDVSISSNARLAYFFANKGDDPLTEMEIEGVLSVMRQTQGYETTDAVYSTAYETRENDLLANPGESSVFTNRRGASQGDTSSNSIQLPPQFTPHYESSTTGSNRSVTPASLVANTPVQNANPDNIERQRQPQGGSYFSGIMRKWLEEPEAPERPGRCSSSLVNQDAGSVQESPVSLNRNQRN